MEDEFVNVRTEMRDGFKNINDQFKNVDDQFKNVDDQFSRIRAEAQDHAETTRGHFDIVAESLRESVKIVAEGNAHSSSRLDNDETRLKGLERPRRR
jgi:hypothetical protein